MFGGELTAAPIQRGCLDGDRLKVVVAACDRSGTDELRRKVVRVALFSKVDLDADAFLRFESGEKAGGLEHRADSVTGPFRRHEVDDRFTHCQTPGMRRPQ